MLFISRNLHEQIRIGDAITLTLTACRSREVTVRLKGQSFDIIAPLYCGRAYNVDVNGANVVIELLKVARDQARFGFIAPAHVRIQSIRAEIGA